MSQSPNGAKYLSVSQVAETLGVSRHTVYQWLEDGVLPSFKLGRRVFIERSDLEAHIAASKAERTAP